MMLGHILTHTFTAMAGRRSSKTTTSLGRMMMTLNAKNTLNYHKYGVFSHEPLQRMARSRIEEWTARFSWVRLQDGPISFLERI